MVCPYCKTSTKVVNSRSHRKSQAVWRRRQCKSCQATWTTDENYDLSTTHRVQNSSDSHFEPFQRDTLFISIFDSLKHRKQATAEASALTDTVIDAMLAQKSPILNKNSLRQQTHQTLAAFDQTAAAVYSALHARAD